MLVKLPTHKKRIFLFKIFNFPNLPSEFEMGWLTYRDNRNFIKLVCGTFDLCAMIVQCDCILNLNQQTGWEQCECL